MYKQAVPNKMILPFEILAANLTWKRPSATTLEPFVSVQRTVVSVGLTTFVTDVCAFIHHSFSSCIVTFDSLVPVQ